MRTHATSYVGLISLLWALPGTVLAQELSGATQRTFTTDADFAQGTFSGARAGAPNPDQLRIDTGASVPNFLWVANANDGAVTKVDTRTGRQVARYDSVLTRNWDNSIPPVRAPRDSCNYPIATAVDARGDAYTVNRGNCTGTSATITKYAGTLAACVDRNGNGVIDTSSDVNGDGSIGLTDTAEFVGQTDECILWTKAYAIAGDAGYALVVDSDQNVWSAGYTSSKLYRLDGQTGAVTKTIDLKAETGTATGIQALAVGPGGLLYASDSSSQRLVRKINPNAPDGAHVVDALTSPVPTYGLAVDRNGVAWLGAESDSAVGIVQADFTAHTIQQVGSGGGCSGRTHGIAVDAAGDIWAACVGSNRVLRVGANGVAKGNWFVSTHPEGVAVAADGKIWLSAQGTDSAVVVNPAVANTTQSYAVWGKPFSLGDMTGYQHGRFVARQGTWRVVHDSGAAGTGWGSVRWNQEAQGATPDTSTITVAVRAANTLAALATQSFMQVSNAQSLTAIQGRYIEVQATLKAPNFSGDPVLSDLTIVTANRAPVAQCQDQNVCAGSACTAQVNVNNGSSDPDGDAITVVQSPAGPYAIGTQTVSLSVSDGVSTTSCSASVRVRDCTPPTITCGETLKAECTGNESATVSAGGVEATDSCSTVSVSGPGLASYPLGNTAVTYTATDAAGNTATCTTSVKVADTLLPTITCPAAFTAECVGGGATNSGMGTASASDVCSAVAMQQPALASFPLGTVDLSWSARDTSGNTATCSAAFTVADTQAPQVALLGSAAEELECGSSYVDPGVSATDACVTAPNVQVLASGTVDTIHPGTYSRTYRAADPSGNTSAAVSRTVKVTDSLPPIVALKGLSTMTLGCAAPYVEPGATVIDACQGDVSDRLTVAGSVDASHAGSYVLTYGATDSLGHAAAPVTRTVTVTNSQGPAITLQGANPLPLECVRDWYSEPGATAVDGCSGDITGSMTIEHPYIDSTVPGTYPVTYRVTDSGGRAATAVRQVNVQDTLAPALYLNGATSMTLECKVNTYSEQGATAIDLCSGNVAVAISGTVNTDAPGSYPVHYRAQDGHGLATEKVREVNVVDTRAPVLTLEGSSAPVMECSRDGFIALGAKALDSCAGDITSRITISGTQDIVSPGTYPITYSVTDPSGNAAPSITRNVTVRDTQAPVVTMVGEANPVLECGVDTYTEQGATAYDACQGDLTSQLHTYGNGANTAAVGTYSIQYGVWDATGNTTTALRTVKVVDRLPPTLVMQGPATVQHECASGPYIDTPATASDACYGDLSSSVTTTGWVNAWQRGSYTLTYNVQDSTPLKAPSLTRTVQVVDTQAPTLEYRDVTVPADQTMHCFSLSDCVTASDTCDGYAQANSGTILSIYSDEPEDAPGDGDGSTASDIVITSHSTFQLRAERQSEGDGRVYGVTFELKDKTGNTRTGLCRIHVPASETAPATDSGAAAGYTVLPPPALASTVP
jgi:hypothetical protein